MYLSAVNDFTYHEVPGTVELYVQCTCYKYTYCYGPVDGGLEEESSSSNSDLAHVNTKLAYLFVNSYPLWPYLIVSVCDPE